MIEYKFEHVGITVNSIEETAKWYESNLGFKRDGGVLEKPDLYLRLCKMKLGDFCLEILEPYRENIAKKNHERLQELLRKPGINHLSISVGNINKSYRKMDENGVQLVTEVINSKYFFCKDNNGISLEIRQKK